MKRVQEGESFVFVRLERQKTRYAPSASGGVAMRAHAGGETFLEGVDFEVDYEGGYLLRTANSRIPDWTAHPLYGVRPFDHEEYPDYSNRDYTVYASYEYEISAENVAVDEGDQASTAALTGLVGKLAAGGEIVYAVLGDSISAGGDASDDSLAFYGRLAAWLEERYPAARVRIVNRSIGGETSEGGAGRVRDDVASLGPDLVTIGYGMNDQNLFEDGNGVALGDYERYIRQMIADIRQSGDAAIVLVTPCEPNPLWQHTSGEIGDYADALRRIGGELGIPVADANAAWRRELAAGKTPESLLLNNINHPNDYGHRLYFEAIRAVFRP
ncbi:SGNH/GDSL hydrolase family protein [Cohnella sp. GCM10027633]|uniref:SGNH/GDSL hydrolase family protein n=1 Tax=unclassified Cohnella TaxID=2636738 RepID=UPI003639CEB4